MSFLIQCLFSSFKSLYCQRLKDYGISDINVHSTRPKENVLSRMPELEEKKKGRNVILLFKEEFGYAVFEACLESSEDDRICLSTTVKIIRKHVFEYRDNANNSEYISNSDMAPIPKSLETFISMITHGTSIVDPCKDKIAGTLSQLICFNIAKCRRPRSIESSHIKHSRKKICHFLCTQVYLFT